MEIVKTLNKKKLSLILGSYWEQCQGGAELQAHYLEMKALSQGWDTHFVFLSNGNKYKKKTRTILHPIKRKKLWNKLGNIKYPYSWRLLEILNNLKPDIIYQRSGIALTGVAAYYAQKNNCKFVFHAAQENDVQPWMIPWQKFYLIPEFKLVQYGIKKADIIIAQTKFQAKRLYENYGKTSVIIPNAHPVPQDCKKNKNKIILLWIGTWKPIKQPEIFVKLVKKIGMMKKVTFIMLGRTENYNKLVIEAQKNNIEVRGEVSNNEVNKILKNAHILINTSKHEGFSNTFIQAWMRRVPVISLRVDPDNILQNKGLGCCCSGNFTKLVYDTKQLITNNIKRKRMGDKAREYAVKNHSMNNINKILKLMKG